jgi:hypothetical protein
MAAGSITATGWTPSTPVAVAVGATGDVTAEAEQQTAGEKESSPEGAVGLWCIHVFGWVEECS